MQSNTPAKLALEDGSVFYGQAFGDTSLKTIDGEVCFNTSLSGYQEILTDPSYAGQLVTMTNPLIGNYGINVDDMESRSIFARGFIVRELSNLVSNYRSHISLDQWLADHKIMAITGIDTRALTRKIRITGAMNGVLSTDNMDDESLVAAARKATGLVGVNMVETVSRSDTVAWSEDMGAWEPIQGSIPPPANKLKVVAIDCGAKLNILRSLTHSGCDVTVLPWNATAEQVLEHNPDGLFMSNGPGDPSAVNAPVEMLKQIRGKLPIFGICLGHQLLSRALGADTFKLKFGHRGGNQPVQNLDTKKVEITSQNHGFAVDIDSLAKVGGEPTHINLNDQTLEGFRHKDEPIFAVQYHPEASPGPHDARYLFDCFVEMMTTGNSPSAEQMGKAQKARNSVGNSSQTQPA